MSHLKKIDPRSFCLNPGGWVSPYAILQQGLGARYRKRHWQEGMIHLGQNYTRRGMARVPDVGVKFTVFEECSTSKELRSRRLWILFIMIVAYGLDKRFQTKSSKMESTNHAFAITNTPLERDILERGTPARAIRKALSESNYGYYHRSLVAIMMHEVPESKYLTCFQSVVSILISKYSIPQLKEGIAIWLACGNDRCGVLDEWYPCFYQCYHKKKMWTINETWRTKPKPYAILRPCSRHAHASQRNKRTLYTVLPRRWLRSHANFLDFNGNCYDVERILRDLWNNIAGNVH